MAGYWDEDSAYYVGYVYMSSFPSRDDILNMLRAADQLENLEKNYVDNLTIERPDGWNYKVIKIFAYGNKDRYIWRIEPAP